MIPITLYGMCKFIGIIQVDGQVIIQTRAHIVEAGQRTSYEKRPSNAEVIFYTINQQRLTLNV